MAMTSSDKPFRAPASPSPEARSELASTGETVDALIPPPTTPAGPRLVVPMAAAQFGLFVALLTPVFASLTIKVQSLVPANQVVTAVATVTTFGAVAAFVANPIFGRLSDVSTGRFGRRRPWLLIGALGLTLSLLLVAVAPDVATVVLAWFLAQMCGNAALAAYTATMADQIPPVQRGKISGVIGVMQNLAVLAAAYVAVFLGAHVISLFLIPALVGLVLVVLLVIVLPDKPLPHRPHVAGGGLRTALMTFWVNPRKHRDFAWAWVSRFLIVLASFMFATYRLLYLEDRFGYTTAKATAAMATGVLIYTVGLVIAAQLAGWASDRTHRRKVFVLVSAMIFAVGTLVLVGVQSLGSFYLAEGVLGIGFGAYMGVDLALVIDVLPNPDDSAKDLGVLNIANAGPQAIAPGFAAVLVNISGHYNLMITVAAVICALGALAILPVRKVR